MKRFVASFLFLLTLSFCCSVQTGATALIHRKYGDINNDQSVDIVDVTLIQRFLAALDSFDGVQKETADFDHNNEVSTIDVTLIQRFISKIEVPESCGGQFEPMSFVRCLYADYESGQAIVGVPVTFTAQGGYPYYEYEIDEKFNPSEYKFEVFSSDNLKEPIFVRDYSEDSSFSFVFERTDCTYRINAYARNRYQFETGINYDNFRVVEPYDLDKPVISSIYTDKYGNSRTNSDSSNYNTSCRWNDLVISAIAKGGSEEYTYAFEYKTNDKVLTQEFSKNNSFTIGCDDFPGWDEYEAIKPFMSSYYQYDPNQVWPCELTVKVKDSNGFETTKTVLISAINGFDLIG